MRGKTEREAIEKAVLEKRDIEEGKVAVSSNMTVSAWAYKAVDTYKTNQKEITRSKYVDRMRHCILEQIGDLPLKAVKPIHCQEVLNRQARISIRRLKKHRIGAVFASRRWARRTNPSHSGGYSTGCAGK